MTWHGDPTEPIERKIRERFAELAAMPHMRPELARLFRMLANRAASYPDVLAASEAAVHALRDVERLVAGQDRLTP